MLDDLHNKFWWNTYLRHSLLTWIQSGPARFEKTLLLLLLLLLFSRFYKVSTSSCAHWTLIVSSFSIRLCHSSLLPLVPFSPISPRIPSAQVSLGLPRFLLPGGFHFIACFGSLPSSILWKNITFWKKTTYSLHNDNFISRGHHRTNRKIGKIVTIYCSRRDQVWVRFVPSL